MKNHSKHHGRKHKHHHRLSQSNHMKGAPPMESAMDQAAETLEKTGGKKMLSDVESIKSSFSQLRKDVMDLLSNAFGLGRHGAEYARDNASDAVESLKSRLTDLKDRGATKMESVEKKIEENPLRAALVAFGVGFVLAKLLTRK